MNDYLRGESTYRWIDGFEIEIEIEDGNVDGNVDTPRT